MAAHAIVAGEGDAFVAAGVECVSRFAKGKADGMPDTKNPRFGTDGLPDVYIAMGETAENVADLEGVTRAEMDAFALESQEPGGDGAGARRLRARDRACRTARRTGGGNATTGLDPTRRWRSSPSSRPSSGRTAASRLAMPVLSTTGPPPWC